MKNSYILLDISLGFILDSSIFWIFFGVDSKNGKKYPEKMYRKNPKKNPNFFLDKMDAALNDCRMTREVRI